LGRTLKTIGHDQKYNFLFECFIVCDRLNRAAALEKK